MKKIFGLILVGCVINSYANVVLDSVSQSITTSQVAKKFNGFIVQNLSNNQVLVKFFNKDNYGYTYYLGNVSNGSVVNLRLTTPANGVNLSQEQLNSKLKITKSTNVQDISCPSDGNNMVALILSPYASKVDIAYNDAERIGVEFAHAKLNTKVLLDNQANYTNTLAYLSCPNIKYVYYVGHGDPTGFGVYKDDNSGFMEITADDINSIASGITGKTVELNSCNTFNGSLKVAFENANVKNFIGGTTYLSMGPSDDASKVFWTYFIRGNKNIGDSLKSAINLTDPSYYLHLDTDRGIWQADGFGFFGNQSNVFIGNVTAKK